MILLPASGMQENLVPDAHLASLAMSTDWYCTPLTVTSDVFEISAGKIRFWLKPQPGLVNLAFESTCSDGQLEQMLTCG